MTLYVHASLTKYVKKNKGKTKVRILQVQNT